MKRLWKRIAAALTASAAVLAVVVPATANAAPDNDGWLPVLDGKGNLIRIDDVQRGGTRSIPPVLGGNFDGRIGNVAIHFAYADQWLDRGRSWRFGNADLRMQNDGNLVIYQASTGIAKWATGTNGSGATQMLFQNEANLGVWTSGWAQRTWVNVPNDRCANGARPVLGLQSDSNFVIYCYRASDGLAAAVWATNTNGI